jgi:pilus assembly protein CpaE
VTRRVALGCAEPDVIERVASVVGELGEELVQVATSSAELLEAVATHEPDVLIVADTLGPVPVLDLIRQAARQDPFVGILLLTSATDPDVFRVAMEAGARSIAPITFTVDDLGQRIEGAASWAGMVRSHIAGERNRVIGTGHVVTLSGTKGGVGTTTIAVHTALEAAASGRRTCLVDLDLQAGDVAALLNITHRRDIVDLVPIAGEISGQALDDVLYRHTSGLEVLLAPREGERGEEVSESVARAILGALKSRFDVIVVDVGSVLTPGGAAGVELADRAVMVATPDVLSMRGARRMARLWDRLQLRREGDLIVLLNRISRNVEVQPDLAARLAKLPFSDIAIPASFRSFEAAANTGEPARVVDRDTRRALARVAESLGARSAGSGSAAGDADGSRVNGNRRGHGGRVNSDRLNGTTRINGADGLGDADGSAASNGAAALNGSRRAAVADGRRTGQPAGRGRGRRGDSGQTAIEFMGLIPVLGVVLACLIQGGLIGYSYILAGHAAASAARVAVSPEHGYGDIAARARDQLPAAWHDQLRVTVDGQTSFAGGDPRYSDPDAEVTVQVHTPAFVPLISDLFGDGLVVSSTAQMRFEGR